MIGYGNPLNGNAINASQDKIQTPMAMIHYTQLKYLDGYNCQYALNLAFEMFSPFRRYMMVSLSKSTS
jgi:hypothetical protein